MQRALSMDSLDDLKINSRFETIKKFDKGGFGHLYRGRDLKMNKEVAIKLVLEKNLKRGEQCPGEAEMESHRALKGVRGVVDFLSGGSWKVQDFKMKYLILPMAQCSVETLLKTNEQNKKGSPPLKEKTTVLVGVQLLETIKDIHGKGWLHRDLKCQNYLFFPHEVPVVQICDFGIACRFRNRRGVRVAPAPLPEVMTRVPYNSPGMTRNEESNPMDDVQMMTYSILRMRGFHPWFRMSKNEKLVKKEELLLDPRNVVDAPQKFLTPFLRAVGRQLGGVHVNYGALLSSLQNCSRVSRSDNGNISLKSNKAGGLTFE